MRWCNVVLVEQRSYLEVDFFYLLVNFVCFKIEAMYDTDWPLINVLFYMSIIRIRVLVMTFCSV